MRINLIDLIDEARMQESQYINSVLIDCEDIQKTSCFNGMIKYIGMNVFAKYQFSFQNDIIILNDIWNNIYTRMVYKYNQNVSIQKFCIFVGIEYKKLKRFMENYSNMYVSPEIQQVYRIVSSWETEIESNHIDGAADNKIGSIFILKSQYGYRDNAPVVARDNGTLGIEDVSSLADRYLLPVDVDEDKNGSNEPNT